MLLYPFLFYWADGPTFAEEEALLASMHGADFEAYRASVPQVFPTTSLFQGLRSFGRGFSWQRISAKEIKRIFRFAFLASLLILAREVGMAGLQQLVAGQNPLSGPVAGLGELCITCLVISLAIPARRRSADDAAVD